MAPQQPNVHAVLGDITEHWSPRTIAVGNDYDVRLVKGQGCFTRHSHPETDEFFRVLSGELSIEMDCTTFGDSGCRQRGLRSNL